MTILNTFDPTTTVAIFNRLNKLNHTTKPQWGKMNVAQMLAHVNVTYDLTYGKIKTDQSFFSKLIMKLFVKGIVTSNKPYPKNSRTGADFIITNERDFETEKNIFINYVTETQTKGTAYFEGKENPAFGVLTAKEWSTQFYKHIDHHFTQFGV